VLRERTTEFDIGAVYGNRGFGYLKKRVAGFNNASKACPFLLLTDLDRCPCAPALIAEWLGSGLPHHPNFLFRIAVVEVESWLLADEASLQAFLGIRISKAILQPEVLADPKTTLLELALHARRDIRDAIVSKDERNGRLGQGPDYNGVLARFVQVSWNIDNAQRKCPSLKGLLNAIGKLEAAYRESPARATIKYP
jgi:hypothetical protein